jgi:hypothetical protein
MHTGLGWPACRVWRFQLFWPPDVSGRRGQVVVDGGGALITPGQPAIVTAWLTSSTTVPVTFLSASLLPVHGFPTGKLTHVALATNHNAVEGETVWPLPPGDGVTLRPLAGAQIRRRGVIGIVFAIRGTVVGQAYTAGGLRVRYRYQGQVYSTVAWLVAQACVVSHLGKKTPPWCTKADDRATKEVQKQADSR